MSEVLLQSTTKEGVPLSAVFAPDEGMNLLSFKKGEIEVIDQSTRGLFLERFAGLGSLIGPHFHHRPLSKIPPIPFENLFPHIARVKAKGVVEPFSHGIARYAPWQYKATKNTLSAKLSSTDLWMGVILSSLEGFNFKMYFDIQLSPDGLMLELGVDAEEPAVIGFHYYYSLQKGPAQIKAQVEEQYREAGSWKKIPEAWLEKGQLVFDTQEAADYGFIPKMKDYTAEIFLETSTSTVKVSYQAGDNDHSFQIYRPKDASYVCIEPLSAKNPQKPTNKKRKLLSKLEILDQPS
jgi:hypothetical protein